jgi:tetratricopeptide (TPR) repeat protein
MSRWLPLLLVAGLAPLLSAQDTQTAQPAQLKKERNKQPEKTSDKEEVPPEEDASLSTQSYSFNPLQAKKDVGVGDEYAKKHNYRAAAGRYRSATKWDDGNQDAWLKLGEAEEKLKDPDAARQAYSKYLELATNSKDSKTAAEIRKRVEKLSASKN